MIQNIELDAEGEGLENMGKILVTGASGDIGRKTLLHLLKLKPANQLIGLVRDPSKAEDLAAKGIELRKGDYFDPNSLSQAFKGVERLMLTSTHAFTDRKTAQGNVIDAAVDAGVRHMVSMSIIRKPGSTYTMPEITNEDKFSEEKLAKSGLEATFVYHPPFNRHSRILCRDEGPGYRRQHSRSRLRQIRASKPLRLGRGPCHHPGWQGTRR